MRIRILLVLSTILFYGCSSVNSDNYDEFFNLSKINVSNSSYDQSIYVHLNQSLLPINNTFQANTLLGAFWSENEPNTALITLNLQSSVDSSIVYAIYRKVYILIGNKEYEFDAVDTNISSSSYNSVSKTILTNSRSSVSVPISLVENMISAPDVRIKIVSSDFVDIGLFHIESGKQGYSFAKTSFVRFLDEVNKVNQ